MQYERQRQDLGCCIDGHPPFALPFVSLFFLSLFRFGANRSRFRNPIIGSSIMSSVCFWHFIRKAGEATQQVPVGGGVNGDNWAEASSVRSRRSRSRSHSRSRKERRSSSVDSTESRSHRRFVPSHFTAAPLFTCFAYSESLLLLLLFFSIGRNFFNACFHFDPNIEIRPCSLLFFFLSVGGAST